ncbi:MULTISPECIES: hypothetical protein [unclassified Novosphingobium]|uniref:hypothetical protein n=1 Tax=unclassified Novosphingobium TaxID=2644732 RepID=UPI0014418652|nr:MULTISPECIES: hypothetical protein [unclassified Novosphingobium]MBB3359485.1 hypothetical protein [Novosphingobium sp. BK256]MBB3375845.1 hypothetical protein [Novosphingobium sp. BK280]MBB3380258.1 hypothetical protein [Novosphingobium sp. BK258]MBB3421953.1 hypothetical protein [Novosphingobium sp. BK267]MBB3450609.1 hypothetical protein [Novosphingobium sp. BK352]
MEYADGTPINIGDEVAVDGMAGIIVADFDNSLFLTGYEEGGNPAAEAVADFPLSSGVMAKTAEAGLIYYEAAELGHIQPLRGVDASSR